MRCPILTNHNTRKDGRCKRYVLCSAQGLTQMTITVENLKELLDRIQTPVDWEGRPWKICPAGGMVLR